MKKLKVILPAILTLAVSTSAAVTGTVAWFTASRLREVGMTGITVVNPETGLELTKVKLPKNVDFVNVENDGTPTSGQIPSITHLKDASTPTKKDLYLRDASFDGTNVYRGIKNETTGQVSTYEPVAEGSENAKFLDHDGLTYGGKQVVYATQFTLSFKSTRTPEDGASYTNELFLDIGASTATMPNSANNPDLNKALRIGFKTDTEWFVWAPFADGYYRDYSITEDNFESNKTGLKVKSGVNYTDASSWVADTPYYRAISAFNYVSDEDSLTPYVESTNTAVTADSNFIKGENTAKTTTLIAEQTSTGNVIKADGLGYVGHLLNLTDSDQDVTVTTWFEGSDENCINDSFGGTLDTLSANLKFVMRRVATA